MARRFRRMNVNMVAWVVVVIVWTAALTSVVVAGHAYVTSHQPAATTIQPSTYATQRLPFVTYEPPSRLPGTSSTVGGIGPHGGPTTVTGGERGPGPTGRAAGGSPHEPSRPQPPVTSGQYPVPS